VNAPVGRTAAQLLLEKTLGTDAHRHRQVTFKPELEYASPVAVPGRRLAMPSPAAARAGQEGAT